jgi:hypothetical protein
MPGASLFDSAAIKGAGFEDALERSKMPLNLRRCPENGPSRFPGIFEEARRGLIAFAMDELSNSVGSAHELSHGQDPAFQRCACALACVRFGGESQRVFQSAMALSRQKDWYAGTCVRGRAGQAGAGTTNPFRRIG